MKKVLIAPLDWGLGHATRCIPIIEALQQRKVEVMIASSGSALALLRKEFPELTFFALPSYRIKYPRYGSFVFAILRQLPKINIAINQEYRRIKKILAEHKFDVIISDNRYGCWSKEIKSIFITHQLSLQLSPAWRLLKPLVDWFHIRSIRKFNQCWIPDDLSLNLTGDLSKTDHVSVTYVGILSRFKKEDSAVKYDVAFVLSGPEPQRSIFEQIVREHCEQHSSLSIIIVRGVIEGEGNWKQQQNLTTVNFLSSIKLEEVIRQSNLVIARSGYSTIMDLARLKKKAVFVPTPGQTEQEYLGKKLMNDKIALCVEQKKFNLGKILSTSEGYLGFKEVPENNLLDDALNRLGL